MSIHFPIWLTESKSSSYRLETPLESQLGTLWFPNAFPGARIWFKRNLKNTIWASNTEVLLTSQNTFSFFCLQTFSTCNLEEKHHTKAAENPASVLKSCGSESQHPLCGPWSLHGLSDGCMKTCGSFQLQISWMPIAYFLKLGSPRNLLLVSLFVLFYSWLMYIKYTFQRDSVWVFTFNFSFYYFFFFTDSHVHTLYIDCSHIPPPYHPSTFLPPDKSLSHICLTIAWGFPLGPVGSG